MISAPEQADKLLNIFRFAIRWETSFSTYSRLENKFNPIQKGWFTMGYLSEVSLVMKKDLFGKICRDIPEEMKELIGAADKFQKQDDCVLLYWNGIRWYVDSGDYAAHYFWNKLQQHTDGGRDYQLIELGETVDHNEERGELWDNPWNTSMVRRIHMDDCGVDVSLDAFM